MVWYGEHRHWLNNPTTLGLGIVGLLFFLNLSAFYSTIPYHIIVIAILFAVVGVAAVVAADVAAVVVVVVVANHHHAPSKLML